MGRPRVYDDPEELEKQADLYFEQEQGKPTVNGLALFLGFASKQSLYDYQENEKFSYPIKRALTMIEAAHEKNLYGTTVTGSIFALKNMGWKDKTEADINQNMNLSWNEVKSYDPDKKTDNSS